VKEERDCLGGRSGRVFRSATVCEAEVSVKRLGDMARQGGVMLQGIEVSLKEAT
jgi:hypothetical protein